MKNIKWYHIVIGVLVIIIMISLIGGGYGYNILNKRINKEIKTQEYFQKESIRKQDSIYDLFIEEQKTADRFSEKADELMTKNKILYEQLKDKERHLAERDTSFRNNSRIISESVDRFYTK